MVAAVGITTIIIVIIISYALSILLKYVTKSWFQKTYEEPLQLEDQWTLVNSDNLPKATAPSEKVSNNSRGSD